MYYINNNRISELKCSLSYPFWELLQPAFLCIFRLCLGLHLKETIIGLDKLASELSTHFCFAFSCRVCCSSARQGHCKVSFTLNNERGKKNYE